MHISFKTKSINKRYTTAVFAAAATAGGAVTFVFIIFHIIISSERNPLFPIIIIHFCAWARGKSQNQNSLKW